MKNLLVFLILLLVFLMVNQFVLLIFH